MLLPDYWLTRPAAPDPAAPAAFDTLLQETLDNGGSIHYTLPYPKWQFLCHIADHHPIALHGSGNAQINLFEPRQANDLNDFGNQKAVYAASDGLWPIFFAIVDRDRYAMSLNNACIRLIDPSGPIHGPYYIFSISRTALPNQPWRTGSVYLLPRATFTSQPPIPFGNHQVQVAQLASPHPVQPLARLTVTPQDFPFLHQIRPHDDARLSEYAAALQSGAPWPADP